MLSHIAILYIICTTLYFNITAEKFNFIIIMEYLVWAAIAYIDDFMADQFVLHWIVNVNLINWPLSVNAHYG